ncbi:unnamed protein product [Parnassius apollo]|uniref:(apollo) hypothetical protein n=1 Tax=Parnassius apollo TaxID=110799 RepID=A0A8S3WC28_PARAO|nr:unnamed protein product [Parnassius apollo]
MEVYFDNLKETLNGVPPSNILNYDETNLADNPGTARATCIWPLNPINVTKRILELYDEVKYGIDNALLEYLKETRSPNPMTVKRSKTLKTEPGKSVCLEDISIKANNTKKTNATNKNKKHINTEEDIVIPMLNENTEEKIETDEEIETYILHETGNRIGNSKKESQKITFQDIGSESPDLCIFGENLRSREENVSFIAHDEKDLTVCLQTQNLLSKNSPSGVKLTANSSPKKLVITSDVKVTSTAKITSTRKKEHIKKKILGAETIRDSALHMKLYPKPKKSNAKQNNILKEIEINNVQPKT